MTLAAIRRTAFAFSCIFISSAQATILVQGNAGAAADHSFDFNLGSFDTYAPNYLSTALVRVVVGAQAVGAQQWAIAQVTDVFTRTTALAFIPCAPQFTKFNGAENTANPLYNSAIAQAKLGVSTIVCTVSGDQRLFAIPQSTLAADGSTSTTLATEALNSAAGTPATAITTISVNQPEKLTNAPVSSAILAAVQDAGLFGSAGNNSGIALAQVKAEENPPTLELFDTVAGGQGNRAAQLDVTMGVISATTGDPASPAQPATRLAIAPAALCINQYTFPYFYAGFSAQSSNTAGYGARSLALGNMLTGIITYTPITPFSAFNGQANCIVATGIPNSPVYAIDATTLQTTTWLNYLVVLGGDSANNTNYNKTIYALPLVSDATASATTGTLAKVDQEPTTAAQGVRYLTQAATAVGDLYTSADIAPYNPSPLVGGTQLPLPDVQVDPADNEYPSSITASGDAIIASIEGAYTGVRAPGAYLSHAIFDQNGMVHGWTRWQRVAGTNNQIHAAFFDAARANYWYLSGNTAASNDFNTVYSTSWGQSSLGYSSDLVQYITDQFTIEIPDQQSTGGVQGLASFVVDPAVNTSGITNGCSLVALGVGQIIYAFTATRDVVATTAWCNPTTNLTDHIATSDDDTFPTVTDPNLAGANLIYNITGPVLRELKALSATDTVTDNDGYYWLVVGGVGGIAILQDGAGNGWAFGDYPANLRFIAFGDEDHDLSFTLKIVHDNAGNMYVLTPEKLFRIPVSAANFDPANLNPTIETIATLTDLDISSRGSFLDIIVTGPLALLATSNGLFRTGNGKNVRTSTSAADVEWTAVSLPQGLTTINQLTFASRDNTMNGILQGGQVYVLESYAGYNQARVHRLFVNIPVGDGTIIDNDSVQVVLDYFTRDSVPNPVPAYFLNFGGFRNNFDTNGAAFINTRPLNAPYEPTELTAEEQVDANLENPPTLKYAPNTTPLSTLVNGQGYHAGTPFSHTSKRLGTNLQTFNALPSIYTGYVSRILSDGGSGTYFVGGDFGLALNE